MPVIVLGVDISSYAKHLLEQTQARRRGETPEPDPDVSVLNEELKRRL